MRPSLLTMRSCPSVDKSPQAGFVTENNSRWRDACSFIIYGLFQAEEYGITSANLADMQKNGSPDMRKFLGNPADFGKLFGLPDDFMSKVISGVGNYAEIYNRNLGPSTPFGIPAKVRSTRAGRMADCSIRRPGSEERVAHDRGAAGLASGPRYKRLVRTRVERER